MYHIVLTFFKKESYTIKFINQDIENESGRKQ